MTEITKEISMTPAFDKRHSDPKKNYGIGGVCVYFYLKGDKGAVQFWFFTDWHFPKVQKELSHKSSAFFSIKPNGADVGYHSPIPMYEGQAPIESECSILGGQCYYGGSSLRSDEVVEILLAEGSDGVWEYLEDFYNETFLIGNK